VVDLALHAVLAAARLKVADVLNIELLTAGRTSQLQERRRWPIMLALLADDPDLLEPFVGLLWTALAMGRSRKATLEVLDNWITSVQKLPDALPELAVVLRLLGDNALSRARLLHLVTDTMMKRPTRPIRPEVAAYLSQVIADPSDDQYAYAGQTTGERR
jgi:hypothetical protein